ncbi:hypothetical protein HY249_00925 [Candidatus Azambacteria bacterium]|nr:hypothetical protein [Candidatus Azambacteria bacterium]
MKKIIYIFILAILSAPQFFVYAAPPSNPLVPGAGTGSIGKEGSFGGTGAASNVEIFFVGLVGWFAWFVALAAVVAGLYSGFLFITAGDDEKQIDKAKKFFIYTIIGVVVAVAAFGIVSLATSIAGL